MDEPPRGSDPRGLRERIKWLIAIRLLIAGALIIATIVLRPGAEGPSEFDFVHFLFFAGGHLAVAIAFGLVFPHLKLKWCAPVGWAQIVYDLLFTTALIYVTGGIDSKFTLLYLLSIFNASVLFFKVGAYTGAFLSSLFYGAMVDMEMLGWIPLQLGPLGDANSWTEQKVMSTILFHAIGFFVIAYFSSYITSRTRDAESRLSAKAADLEDLEVLMRRIVESMTSGLATLDAAGRISFWSRAAEEVTGWREYEVRGKTFLSVFPGAKEHMKTPVEGAPLVSRPWRWEMTYVSGSGEEKILGFSMSPLHQASEADQGTLLIFQDLTRFREMEDKMKRQDRLAAVGELAARMAHEIRNPLTSVAGSIEVLRSQLDLKDQDRKLMDIVVRETDRLNTLLTDFLRFARPSAPRMEEVLVDRLLKETAQLFSKSQTENGRLKLEIDAEESVQVNGDPQQLSQMFWNLAKNASEAMPDGGTILLSARKDTKSGDVVIRVQDSGSGIPREIQDRIFNPFFTTKTRGTGLGLATVRRIAEDHGGSAGLERSDLQGTVFEVRLPADGVG